MIKIIYPKPKCYFAALVLYTIETKVRGIRLAENLSRAPKVLCVYSICAMISETIIYANSEIFDNVLLPILNFLVVTYQSLRLKEHIPSSLPICRYFSGYAGLLRIESSVNEPLCLVKTLSNS